MSKDYPELLDQLHRPTNAGIHIRILMETLTKLTPIYEELIRQGCKEGIFCTEHPRECAELILYSLQFLTDTGIYSWTHDDLKRRIKAFPNLIEQQLKATSGSLKFLFQK